MKESNGKPEAFQNRALLAGKTTNSSCDNCFENLIFALKDNSHEFSIGLLTILECLKFAEDNGAVPTLPYEWWLSLKSRYQME